MSYSGIILVTKVNKNQPHKERKHQNFGKAVEWQYYWYLVTLGVFADVYLSGSIVLFANIRVKKTGSIAAHRCLRVYPLTMSCVHLYIGFSAASSTLARR